MQRDGAFIFEMQVDGKLVPIQQETLTLLYSESVYGLAVYELSCLSSEFATWDKIVTQNDRINIRLRWGLEKTSGRVWSNWRSIVAENIKLTYLLSGVKVEASGTCGGMKVMDICHKNVFCRRTISSMVREIARQNGMKVDVVDTKDQYDFYQCTMKDGHFLYKLVPHAVDQTGVGGYRFFVRNGDTLVFRPPGLASAKLLGVFTNDPRQEGPGVVVVDQFTAEIRRVFQADEDHGSVEVRGFNPLRKQSAVFNAREDTVQYERLARNSYLPLPTTSSIRLSVQPDLGQSSPGNVREEATSRWSRNAQSLFRLYLRVPPIIDAEVGQVMKMISLDDRGRPHWTSGTWGIYEVVQEVRPNGTTSFLGMERRNWT